MSAFAALKNATITYASLTGTDEHGDRTYGAQDTFSARYREGAVRWTENGRAPDVADKVTTDELELTEDMVFWLPDDDPATDPGRAPKRTGKSSTAGITISYAEF